MRNRMYGGVRGRKTKVGGKPTFVFLLLDYGKKIVKILLFSGLVVILRVQDYGVSRCPLRNCRDLSH